MLFEMWWNPLQCALCISGTYTLEEVAGHRERRQDPDVQGPESPAQQKVPNKTYVQRMYVSGQEPRKEGGKEQMLITGQE